MHDLTRRINLRINSLFSYFHCSHAINAYLVDKYASNDTLYPKDPILRARVDHMLHLDTGLLYPMYRGDVTVRP